ncbi:MAG: FAD-binding oxidoreductase [Proteobacteria bacterium]|nr:FAD-binding oxidoreductase [Pseudomonadota bacterium]
MIARETLRWNGWGRLGESTEMTRTREVALLAELGRRLGRPLARGAEPVELDAIRLPPSKLTPEVLAQLRAACGEDGVRTSAFERVTHAVGRSLPDLLRLRRGEIGAAPEAVVYPAEEGAVAAVLRVAADANLAVIPFGGGSSVVGGVEPRTAAGQAGALSLDTTRLDRLLRLDAESHTATFQAGIDGPALEAALALRGYTLGHFPQSFEHSTLGGWIATRSVGQQSDGYGGIEDLLVCARVVTPAGVIRTLDVPRAASGPELNQLLLGSEGVLGVIVEATVRVRPSAARSDERGMLFRSFAAGVAAVREAARAEIPVAMMRLSDGAERRAASILPRARSRSPNASATAVGAARCSTARRAATHATSPRRCVARATCSSGAAACRSVARPVARGGVSASARHTCATGCSTTAWRSTRWRRRCRGHVSKRVTTPSCALCAAPPRHMPAPASRCRTSRTAISTARVSTSRSSTRSRSAAKSSSGARSSATPPKRSSRPAARSRTTTVSASIIDRGWCARRARSASKRCAR